MRKLILFLIALMVSTGVSIAQETYDYELNVGTFSKLKVINSSNVVYICNPDSAGYAHFRAPKAMADFFIVSNSNGTLKVENMPVSAGTKNLPTLYVYSEFLEEVQNAADSTVYVRNVAPCPRFKATQIGNGRLFVDNLRCTQVDGFLNTGNGTIALEGTCTTANFKMVGTGLIQGDALKADVVKCMILGSGSIGCWPRFDLEVKGIGSTKIYYKGNPRIKKRGGGKLLRLDPYDVEDEYQSADE